MHSLLNFLFIIIYKAGFAIKICICYSRFVLAPVVREGTWWRRWLGHCTTTT